MAPTSGGPCDRNMRMEDSKDMSPITTTVAHWKRTRNTDEIHVYKNEQYLSHLSNPTRI